MKIVVLDAASLGEDLSLSPLAALGELVVYPHTAPEELVARVAEADVLVQNKVRITRQAIAAAPHLRLICEAATGYDNIDVEAAREYGVAVARVPGYSTPAVVQVTLAMVLSLATHLPAYDWHVQSGAYVAEGRPNCLIPVYHELAGATWGVVGYGDIGRGVADVARALGCHVIYHRRQEDASPAQVSLAELCQRADIITLHVPLTEQTRHMIGEEQLRQMKPGAILVNVARGAVVDEEAVARAVCEGRLGAFGCDVYSSEPFAPGHPYTALYGRENVCLTPHMAWGSYEARVRCLATIVSNMQAYFRGERQNRVD